MKRVCLMLAMATLLPAAASAQKPSNSAETRSADVYIANSQKSSKLADERESDLLAAIEIAHQGALKEPNNPRPWFLIGTAQAMRKNYLAADSAFDKAVAMWPEYEKEVTKFREQGWVELYNDGITKIKAGDIPGGIEQLKLADIVYRGRHEALQSLGSVYLQTGDLKNAEATYRSELEILRGPARKGLDAKKEAAWAEAELNAVKALATMMSELDRNAEAETLYRELLQRMPDNTAVMSNLAITLTRQKKTAEANTLYNKMLAAPNLTAFQLLNIGIGLHNASEYARAAQAFGRAAEISPYSRDVREFQIRALTGVADELTKSREGKTGDALKPIDAELSKTYTALIDVSDKLLALDPANAGIMMNLAAAQRGMSDIDPANAKAWRDKVLATLTKHSEMPFSLMQIASEGGEKSVTITGKVMGMEKGKAGSPATVRFHLLDKAGKSVAQKDVTVVVPAKEQTSDFTVTIDAPAEAETWKYEIL